MSRTGLSPSDIAESFRDRCGDGSVEWVYTPMQTWVLLDAADMLDENAKLRELVADMWGFIEGTDEDCGDVTFSSCFDYCKHDTADDGCSKTGECWYEQRMRELGVDA